ncbi:thioesterase [Agromyces rhizosphaerae]|uniref:Thioesterase n=1 Tax=Agromyces rhizosphaerae TaxID=88374 RepID=A0A9W6CR18_9MICO|nr:alpha/beta hydrolase [Agromyces rhizosphaerae]GLI26938.1 thioesterase [Agromyces rhizosphaerae]
MSTPFTHTHAGRAYSGRSNLEGLERAAGAPLVIALHGGTYTSEYFDIPGYSLLDRAADEGVPVIGLDRPNYVGSDPLETDDSIILANAELLGEAIGSIWEQYGDGAPGVVLLGHSIGGAVATAIAASKPSWPLLGLATSGCLVRVPQESRGAWESLPPIPMIDLPVPMKDQVMFGPAGTFGADMPAASHPSNTLVPKVELLDITGGWIERRAEMCAAVEVPVHHRQGEFDALWVTDEGEVDQYRAGFTSAPSVDIDLQRGSGHCIDFHSPGADFQRSQLEFAREVAKAAVA